MAGMMPTEDPAQAAPAAPADAGMPQDQPPMQAANDNKASPEEDAQCTKFVAMAMELIAKLAPQIHEMLRGGGEEGSTADDHGANGPIKGLAEATVMVLAKVGSAAEEAGQQLSPDVVFAAGTQILEQLAEESDSLGISDYAHDKDSLEAAYYLAIDTAIQQMAKSGELDQESAKAALEKLKQMDASGELEQIFQSLDAKDQGGKQGVDGSSTPPAKSGGMMPQEK